MWRGSDTASLLGSASPPQNPCAAPLGAGSPGLGSRDPGPPCCCFSPLPCLGTFTPQPLPPPHIPRRRNSHEKLPDGTSAFLTGPTGLQRKPSADVRPPRAEGRWPARGISSFSKPVQAHEVLWPSSLHHGEAWASGGVVTTCS